MENPEINTREEARYRVGYKVAQAHQKGAAVPHSRGNEEDHRCLQESPAQSSIAIQAATGVRFGELVGLHVEDLDFENSLVHIRRSVYKHQEIAPKTDAGYRDVNVDTSAMKIVKEYVGDRTTGRIFDSNKGTPLVCGDINRYVLRPLLKKLGIPPATTHAFRHGRVSILQLGDLIKEWVGHTHH